MRTMLRLPAYDEVVGLPSGVRRPVPAEYADDNGHLNVRHYLGMFDDAEWVIFEEADLGTDHARAGVGGIFALEQHLTYRREVAVGDDVSAHVRLLGRSERMIHFVSYLANHSHGEVAASMEALNCYVDLRTRRLAPIPRPQGAVLDRIVERAAALPWQPDLTGLITLR